MGRGSTANFIHAGEGVEVNPGFHEIHIIQIKNGIEHRIQMSPETAAAVMELIFFNPEIRRAQAIMRKARANAVKH